MSDKQFVISFKTIFTTFLVVLGAYVFYKLAPIIGILIVSLFLVISMEPAVKFFGKLNLMNKPLSRGFSVILAYLLLVMALILILTLGIPSVLFQAQNLLLGLSRLPQTLTLSEGIEVPLMDFLPSYSQISGGLLSTTYSIFSNLAAIVSVLVISAYISLDWPNIKVRFLSLLPKSAAEDALYIIGTVENNIGHWVKGQLTLMLAVGGMSFVALEALGIGSALALALIAGLLEIVPMLGPAITAIIITIVGFSYDPLKGIIALGLFVLIQQIENNFLTPRIMGKVSGLRPIVVIFAILVGGRFFGVAGALLAVPAVMISIIVIKRILKFPS